MSSAITNDGVYKHNKFGNCVRLNGRNYPLWMRQIQILLTGAKVLNLVTNLEIAPPPTVTTYVHPFELITAPKAGRMPGPWAPSASASDDGNNTDGDDDSGSSSSSSSTFGNTPPESEEELLSTAVAEYRINEDKWIQKTEINPRWEEYDKRQHEALAMLNASLADEIQQSLSYCTTAQILWAEIQKTYSASANDGTMDRISNTFGKEVMRDKETIQQWYGRLRGYQTQLVGTILPITDYMLRSRLLEGLPKQWENTRQAIINYTLDRSVSYAVSRLQEMEQRFRSSKVDANSSNIEANNISTVGFQKKKGGYRPPFENARREGRSDKKGRSDKSGHRVAKATKCWHCGKDGHREAECRVKKQGDRAREEYAASKSDSATASIAIARSQELDHYYADLFENDSASAAIATTSHVNTGWIIDSGATVHLTYQKNDLHSYHKFENPRSVKVANGKVVYAYGKGNVKISPAFTLVGVWWAPKLAKRLVSTGWLRRLGYKVHLDEVTEILDKDGNVVATAVDVEERFGLQEVMANAVTTTPSTVNDDAFKLWHVRLGHLNQQYLRDLLKSSGFRVIATSFICDICMVANSKASFGQPIAPAQRQTQTLELIHCDLSGPFNPPTIGGSRFFITLTDDCTRWTVVETMKAKTEAPAVTFRFIQRVHNLFDNYKIKRFRCDNGTAEFNNDLQRQVLSAYGINYEPAPSHHQSSNGVSERKNDIIYRSATALLAQAGLPLTFWGEAVITAIYLRNRSPTSALVGRCTPYEMWNGKKPDLTNLKSYGCQVWYHLAKVQRHEGKFSDRARRSVLVGYVEESQSIYKLWNGNRFVMSNSVTFHENVSPYQILDHRPDATYSRRRSALEADKLALENAEPRLEAPSTELNARSKVDGDPSQVERPALPVESFLQALNVPSSVGDISTEVRNVAEQPVVIHDAVKQPAVLHDAADDQEVQPDEETPSSITDVEITAQTPQNELPLNCGRVEYNEAFPSTPPSHGDDHEMTTAPPLATDAEHRSPQAQAAPQEVEPPRKRQRGVKAYTPRPATRSGRLTRLTERWTALATSVQCEQWDPQTYKEAMSRVDAPKWLIAMNEELKSLRSNDTFVEVSLPAGKSALACKWVFKIKIGESSRRYKARLVIRGDLQDDLGLETFAPVARMTTFRLLMTIVALENLELHQMDVQTAFLYAPLEDEVYMQFPDGMTHRSGRTLRLKRALYGLKQAPRLWNSDIHKTLIGMGFMRSALDESLYVNLKEKSYILLYVDDLLIAAVTVDAVSKTKRALSSKYDMTDLGEAKTYLGVNIQRHRQQRTVLLNQEQMIESMLLRYDMAACNAVATPILATLTADGGEKLSTNEHQWYRQLVGKFMYLMTSTRPDLAYTLSRLSKFTSSPSTAHGLAAKHLLKYLRGTSDLGILLGTDQRKSASRATAQAVELLGYTDADFAADVDSRRSTSGYVFQLGNGPISWKAKQQAIVAASTMGLEYVAASESAKEAVYLHRLIQTFDFSPVERLPPTIMIDNAAAEILATNPKHHERAKHIDIKFHFIRDYNRAKLIRLQHVASEDNIADLLTKVLAREKHQNFVRLLGMSTSA